MLDFGAGEFVVVGVVALIAIGPKELPGVLRAIGRSVGKMRRMAGDFQNQFNDAMREMELEEARKKVEEMGKSVSDSVEAATHIDLGTDPAPVSASSSEMLHQDQTTPSEDHPFDHAGQPPNLAKINLPEPHIPDADAILSDVQKSVNEAPKPDLSASVTPSESAPFSPPADTQNKGA